MANYDSKLGEWFKHVEQHEQKVKAKKNPPVTEAQKNPGPVAQPGTPTPKIRKIDIEAPAADAPMAVVATVDSTEVVADSSMPDSHHQPSEKSGKLFMEEEPPAVEDFFSFLNRSRGAVIEEEAPAATEEPASETEIPADQGTLNMSEGTGQPRPLPKTETPKPVTPGERIVSGHSAGLSPTPPQRSQPSDVIVIKPKPAGPELTQANWDRIPAHLQMLFGAAGEEIAQNSYKAFKETRDELIQRLLDPTISLEEAARMLNVCPTTVRRYTNRGALKHYRTAGNQRRFKLSDVLLFMEYGKQTAKTKTDDDKQ